MERFYFDTLNGVEAYMEVGWNSSAIKDKMVRICVEGKEIIIRQEDLETYLLAITNDPSRFMKSTTRKVGIKYVPVEKNEYRKYQEYKKYKNKILIH